MELTRKIGITPRYGGGLLVVVHLRAPMRVRRGTTRKLLRELELLQDGAASELAVQARALKLFLQVHTSAEGCAMARAPRRSLTPMAPAVRKGGVDALVQAYRPRLRRNYTAEFRAEVGVLAAEESAVGRVARAVCLYVDGIEPAAALAEVGIPYLHMQVLADRVRDRGIAYLRHRFRNGSGWRKEYEWTDGPRKRRSERGLVHPGTRRL